MSSQFVYSILKSKGFLKFLNAVQVKNMLHLNLLLLLHFFRFHSFATWPSYFCIIMPFVNFPTFSRIPNSNLNRVLKDKKGLNGDSAENEKKRVVFQTVAFLKKEQLFFL